MYTVTGQPFYRGDDAREVIYEGDDLSEAIDALHNTDFSDTKLFKQV